MTDPHQLNVQAIREALDNPQPAPELAEPGDAGPDMRGGPGQERPPFPAGCPVTPLGVSSNLEGSQLCYYRNWNGQIVGLEAGNRHGKNSLIHLFGPSSDWLEANFPQWSKPVYEGRGAARTLVKESEIIGFDQAEASRAMIEECVRRGIFDPAGKMRGAGAHRQSNGGLVLHCGDKMLVSRHYATTGALRDWQWIDPGLHDGFVYTAAAAMPRPWHEPCHPEGAQRLLQLLLTWNWKRPLLDARLVLGAIGASMIGGWLPWRPHIWYTGGRGTGKSTLNGEGGVLDQLFGTGQFRTDNTSAAAIRAQLQNSTVPVMLDELEAEADNRRVSEVIETMRVASSGGKITRSSSEQKLKEFTLRSCFHSSSINIPPMKPQDRSRLAICELRPLKKDAPPPDLTAMNLPQLGRKLQRRMIDQLFRLEATKLAFHAALQAAGHDARACDQFGTLLACADLLLHDREGVPTDDEIQQWQDECRPGRMAEISDEEPDHVLCLRHLLTSEVQARGGDERVALETWIGDAVAFEMAPLLEDSNAGDERANGRLAQMGLKLVNARWNPGEAGKDGRWGARVFDYHEPAFLAVSNNHQALKKLFAGQAWQDGGWVRTLGRFDGALERVTVKFGRHSQRAVLVPLHRVLDEDELPNASQRQPATEWMAANGPQTHEGAEA